MLFKFFFKNARIGWRQLWPLVAAGLGLAAHPASAQQSWGFFSGPEIAARAAVLMNADTGEILYAREPHLRLPPASTTKVLTAMVVLEHLNPGSRLQASFQAASVVPSRIGLRAGEMASTHDLLYGLMLKSGNDAAETLAEAAGGSVYGFSSLMNAKAWQIGARNSHFINPHGLPDDDHYSTAYDLALIFRQAMKYPLFADIVGTRSAMLRIESGQSPFGDSRFVPVANHNRLLETYEGTLGGKTGFTQKARRCFVGEVNRGGVRLIVSILNSPTSRTLWQDAHTLLDYGFARHGLTPQPAQPSFEARPIMARAAPVMTPDAARLAALSSRTGFSSSFSDNDLEPAQVSIPASTPPTANRVIAGYVPAARPSSKPSPSKPSSAEDEDETLVWSRPTPGTDERPPASSASRKSATVAAAKQPAEEPLVWSRRATTSDSQELEPETPTKPEAVAAAKPTDKPALSSQRTSAAPDRKPESGLPQKPETVAATKPLDEPLVWTRRTTPDDVEKLEAVAAVNPAPASRKASEDDFSESVSTESARPAETTAMIVDRPAVRQVDDEEQAPGPARVKRPSAAKAIKAEPTSKTAASAQSAPPTKLAATSAKARNAVKQAVAETPAKVASAKAHGDNARLPAKPALASAKAKLNAGSGDAKGQDDEKQAKTSKSAKSPAVAVKPDKGASAKVIARAEPTVVKLPQKNVKRRI